MPTQQPVKQCLHRIQKSTSTNTVLPIITVLKFSDSTNTMEIIGFDMSHGVNGKWSFAARPLQAPRAENCERARPDPIESIGPEAHMPIHQGRQRKHPKLIDGQIEDDR